MSTWANWRPARSISLGLQMVVLVIRRRDMIAAFFRGCQSPLWSWGGFDPLGFASFFIGFFRFWRQRHSMCPVRQMSDAGFILGRVPPNQIARVSILSVFKKCCVFTFLTYFLSPPLNPNPFQGLSCLFLPPPFQGWG